MYIVGMEISFDTSILLCLSSYSCIYSVILIHSMLHTELCFTWLPLQPQNISFLPRRNPRKTGQMFYSVLVLRYAMGFWQYAFKKSVRLRVQSHQLTQGLRFTSFCNFQRQQRFPNSSSLLENAEGVPLPVFILPIFHYPWNLVSLKDAP